MLRGRDYLGRVHSFLNARNGASTGNFVRQGIESKLRGEFCYKGYDKKWNNIELGIKGKILIQGTIRSGITLNLA